MGAGGGGRHAGSSRGAAVSGVVASSGRFRCVCWNFKVRKWGVFGRVTVCGGGGAVRAAGGAGSRGRAAAAGQQQVRAGERSGRQR